MRTFRPQLAKNPSRLYHVRVIYLVSLVNGLALLIGAVSLGVFGLLWFRDRHPLWRDYLLFHASYSLIMVFRLAGVFLHIAGIPFGPQVLGPHLVASMSGVCLLVWTMPRFYRTLVNQASTPRFYRVFPVLAIISAATIPLVFFPLESFLLFVPLLLGMASLLLAMAWCQIDLVRNLASIKHSLGRISLPAILVYNVLCLSAAVFDAMAESNQMLAATFPVGLSLQALVYIFWNIITIIWALRRIAHLPAKPATATALASAPDLSPREQEIAALVAQGLSNKEIAGRLNLSEYTVRNQLHGMFRKTGARSRLDLVNRLRAP